MTAKERGLLASSLWTPGFLTDRRGAGLHGLENTLEFLKLALDKSASLTREPAPWVSRISITLGLKAGLAWEPAPWASSRISLSGGDGFGKGRGNALDFVTGLTWAVAESLEFVGSGYINVRNRILNEKYWKYTWVRGCEGTGRSDDQKSGESKEELHGDDAWD